MQIVTKSTHDHQRLQEHFQVSLRIDESYHEGYILLCCLAIWQGF